MTYGILTATDFFTTVRDEWWLKHIIPHIDALTVENYKEITPLIDRGIKLDAIDGDLFYWADVKIIGNDDRTCAEGTILDLKDSRSMIFPAYVRMKALSVMLRMLVADGVLPEEYREGFAFYYGDLEYTLENIIAEIKKLRPLVFSDGGVFDQIIAKAEAGEWKL